MSDEFLGGRIKLVQKLYKATSDAVLLSSFVAVKTGQSILDIGVGTGVISMCLMAENPNIKVCGIDNFRPALDEARVNATLNQFDIELIEMDITEKDVLKGRFFDHVVSNPPFYSESSNGQSEYKKRAHHIVVPLEKWVLFSMKKIKPKGTLTLMIRPGDLGKILPLMEKKLGNIQIYPIYSKENEMANRVVIQGTLGRKTETKINKPIIIHQKNGTYYPEINDILRGKRFNFPNPE